MKPLKQKISITVDESILVQIKDLADQDDRSLSQYINLVLRKHIETINKAESGISNNDLMNK